MPISFKNYFVNNLFVYDCNYIVLSIPSFYDLGKYFLILKIVLSFYNFKFGVSVCWTKSVNFKYIFKVYFTVYQLMFLDAQSYTSFRDLWLIDMESIRYSNFYRCRLVIMFLSVDYFDSTTLATDCCHVNLKR